MPRPQFFLILTSVCILGRMRMLRAIVCYLSLFVAAPFSHAADSPLFDIPRLPDISVDGRPEDWGDGGGFRVDMLADRTGAVLPSADFDARFRLAWDDRGILVLVTARDDVPMEVPDEQNLWQGDWVEIYLADRRGGTEMVQCLATPGRDPKHNRTIRKHVLDHRKNESLKKKPVEFEAARTATKDGYVLEALIPWDNVAVEPEEGLEVG